jgi:hypothetical protein
LHVRNRDAQAGAQTAACGHATLSQQEQNNRQMKRLSQQEKITRQMRRQLLVTGT